MKGRAAPVGKSYKAPETLELEDDDAAADLRPYSPRARHRPPVAAMTVKRRNHGRNKHGRGHVKFVRCDRCGKCVPKDKAIKRFKVFNIVKPANLSDVKEACALENYVLPKYFQQERWCVGCALRLTEVRVRSRANRKDRAPPRPYRPREERPGGQVPRPGGVGGATGGFDTAPAPNVAGA